MNMDGPECRFLVCDQVKRAFPERTRFDGIAGNSDAIRYGSDGGLAFIPVFLSWRLAIPGA